MNSSDDTFLQELKEHIGNLGITSLKDFDALRKIWRERFKYLSSLKWDSNDELNTSLQSIETSYDFISKLGKKEIKQVLKDHGEFLLGKQFLDLLFFKSTNQFEISLLLKNGNYIFKSVGDLQNSGARTSFLHLLTKAFRGVQYGSTKGIWKDLKHQGVEFQFFKNTSNVYSHPLPDEFWENFSSLLKLLGVFVTAMNVSAEAVNRYALIEANVILKNADRQRFIDLPPVEQWASNYKNIVSQPSKLGALRESFPDFMIEKVLSLSMGEGSPLASDRNTHALSYEELSLLFCNFVDFISTLISDIHEQGSQPETNLEIDPEETREQINDIETLDLIAQLESMKSRLESEKELRISHEHTINLERMAFEVERVDHQTALDRKISELQSINIKLEKMISTNEFNQKKISQLTAALKSANDQLNKTHDHDQRITQLSEENKNYHQRVSELTFALKNANDDLVALKKANDDLVALKKVNDQHTKIHDQRINQLSEENKNYHQRVSELTFALKNANDDLVALKRANEVLKQARIKAQDTAYEESIPEHTESLESDDKHQASSQIKPEIDSQPIWNIIPDNFKRSLFRKYRRE